MPTNGQEICDPVKSLPATQYDAIASRTCCNYIIACFTIQNIIPSSTE
ncbi:hypothetical protein HC928_21295 [bacterium]|nr:hypothetical protein [bacterium]